MVTMGIERRGFLKLVGSLVSGMAALPLVRRTAWAGKVEDESLRGLIDKGRLRPVEYILGFDRTIVAPGELVTVGIRTQVAVRPERLIIPSTIAGSFQIEGLKFANVSQLPGKSVLPAAVFSEAAFGVALNQGEMICVREGRLIEISVRNITDQPASFMGAVVGAALVNNDPTDLIEAASHRAAFLGRRGSGR